MGESGTEPARLIGEIVAPLVETDFAKLSVNQQWQQPPDANIFASSTPGALGMICGSRHAKLHVTVQRWSSRPAAAGEDWEDVDEIPFEPLPEAGPLYIFGFDEPGVGGPALDVSGLGRCVARVCASNRHIADRRYDADGDQTTERWLVQLWPDAHGLDPMHAEPRILKTPPRPPKTFDELDQSTGASDPYYHEFPAKWDVHHLMRWSPNQVLRTTPFAMAQRLNVSLDHVTGALVALIRHNNVICSLDPKTADPHDEIEVRRG